MMWVARKGNLVGTSVLYVHSHHELEGAVVVVEVAIACQKFNAHCGRELLLLGN